MLLRFLARPHLELLDFIWFVVVNGDGTDVIAVCWNCAVSCCVCLQRADDHVLARISVSGCNDEGVVLLVRVSWCKRWSLHTCPPSFAGKLKTMRREVCARFLRITDEHCELLGSRRDEHFILHVRRELLLHEVQLPCSDRQPLKLFRSSLELLFELRSSLGFGSCRRFQLLDTTRTELLHSFCRAVHAPPTLLAVRPQPDSWALPVAVHVSELTLHMTLVGEKFPRA